MITKNIAFFTDWESPETATGCLKWSRLTPWTESCFARGERQAGSRDLKTSNRISENKRRVRTDKGFKHKENWAATEDLGKGKTHFTGDLFFCYFFRVTTNSKEGREAWKVYICPTFYPFIHGIKIVQVMRLKDAEACFWGAAAY